MILLVLVCLILIMGGGFTYVALAHPPGSPSDWAAWTQAAFSILAIVASVGLVEWQAYRDKRKAEADARAERHRYLETTFQLVGGAEQVLQKVAAAKPHPGDLHRMRAELSALAGGLSALDLSRLSGRMIIESIVVTVGAVSSTIATIDEQRRRLNEGPAPNASDGFNEASKYFLHKQLLEVAFQAIGEAATYAAGEVGNRAKHIASLLDELEQSAV